MLAFAAGEGLLHGELQLGRLDDFAQTTPDRLGRIELEHASRRRIEMHDLFAAIDGDHALGHGAEDGEGLVPIGGDGVVVLADAQPHRVEGAGEGAEFVAGLHVDRSIQLAAADGADARDDLAQGAREAPREHESQHQGHEECGNGREDDRVAQAGQALIDGVERKRRADHADHAAGVAAVVHGERDVHHLDVERVAAARRASRSRRERLHDFGPVGVVVHDRRVFA